MRGSVPPRCPRRALAIVLSSGRVLAGCAPGPGHEGALKCVPSFRVTPAGATGQPGPRLLTIPRSPADMPGNGLTFRAPVRRTVHERLATDRPSVPRARRSLLPVDIQAALEVSGFPVDVDVQRVKAGATN